jgi:transcription antitermination protein NusB
MSLPQQKFRELVFQFLYSYDIGRPEEADLMDLLMKELAVTRKAVRAANERVHQLLQHQREIDELISKATISYEFERIQSVERNILRLGVFELFYDPSIPYKVAISEAIRLARKFGTPESSTFINAVLDALYKSSLGEKPNEQEIRKSQDALSLSESVSSEAAQQELKDDSIASEE